MTMTVKPAPVLEPGLRKRSAALGRPAPGSAFEAGRDLFGKHAGPVNLASDRKANHATAVTDNMRPAHAGRAAWPSQKLR